MEVFTVSFFGHRRLEDVCSIEKKLDRIIRRLLGEHPFVEFLVGRDGDFDQLVSSAVKRAQRTFRDGNSALVWVLPYATAQLRENLDSFEAYYDEIYISESAGNVHPKAAFLHRNREMVDRSDLVVAWVSHPSGGAYQALAYARKCGTEVINLCREE